MRINQDEWEKLLIDYMTEKGWINDRYDETYIGFSFVEGKHYWIRDYDRKTRRFIHLDGNLVLNLRNSENNE